MKKCSSCKTDKDLNCFSFKNAKTDRRNNICKECHKKYRHDHYLMNKEKVLTQVKDWRQRNPNRKAGMTFESKCEACGAVIYITKKALDNKENRFCGRECYLEHYRSDGIRNCYIKARRNAATRKKEFTITEDHIRILWDKQNGRCAVTNVSLIVYPQRVRKKLTNAASLDRIDSSKGYIDGNVQWVLLGINYMKKNWPQSDLLDLLDLIKVNYTRE